MNQRDMEIKEFIKETIVQIFEGISDAQKEVDGKLGLVNPPEIKLSNQVGYSANAITKTTDIDFELAVTENDNNETKGGLSVLFGNINLGSSIKKGNENTVINRVKFSVPVVYPFK